MTGILIKRNRISNGLTSRAVSWNIGLGIESVLEIHLLGIQSPVWLLPSRLNGLTPRDFGTWVTNQGLGSDGPWLQMNPNDKRMDSMTGSSYLMLCPVIISNRMKRELKKGMDEDKKDAWPAETNHQEYNRSVTIPRLTKRIWRLITNGIACLVSSGTCTRCHPEAIIICSKESVFGKSIWEIDYETDSKPWVTARLISCDPFFLMH